MNQSIRWADWVQWAIARFAPTVNRMTRIPLLLPVLIVLLAFALRVHHLDAQSLWNDEGNSLRLAQRTVPDLIDAAGRDIHPPGYYLALKAWISLAGESEFSLRALSMLMGVLTVAVTIALGRALFSRSAGMIAGLLVALSPLAVYYSQETRMYAALALLSAASMWAFVEWLRCVSDLPLPSVLRAVSPPRKRRGENASANGAMRNPNSPFLRLRGKGAGGIGVLLALINAAGLYTQYSFPFTMLAQGVIVVGWLIFLPTSPPQPLSPAKPERGKPVRATQRVLIPYIALNLLTLLLVLPWLPTAYDQITTWPRTGVDIALDQQLRTVLTWIIYGNTAGDVSWLRFLWPGLLIALAVGRRNRARQAAPLLPVVWTVIVAGALFVSGAYREANLKFLLPAQIAVALLLGQGAVLLWRWNGAQTNVTPTRILSRRERRTIAQMLAVMCVFLVAIGQSNALHTLYTDADYARDDYRAMVRLITADPRPGDAVILDAPNQAEVFGYYYDAAAPVYELPRGLGGDDDQTRADVQAVIAQHRRIFVLFWGEEERDPHRVVQTTLDADTYPVASQWYGDVRLAHYVVLDPTPESPQVTFDAQFGDAITLTGYALTPEIVQPGDAVGVTLYWTTDAALAVRYKVTVQILWPDGSLLAQHDAEPGGNRALTTTWTPGEIVRDTHGLVLPPDLPPGHYTLIAGLYDINTPAERLPVAQQMEPMGDVFPLPALVVAE